MGKRIFDIIMSERDSRSGSSRDYYNNYDYKGDRIRRDDYMMRGDYSSYDSRYDNSRGSNGRDMQYYDNRSYDRSRGMDRGYSSNNHYLSREDMMKWERKIGKHFDESKLMPYLDREKIDFSMKDYTKDEMILLVNVMYSDYKEVLGEDPMNYIKMAKCFLEDKDSTIKGGEKLCAYYCLFVCDED